MRKIILHPVKAHRDEFLAASLLLATQKDIESIQRIDPRPSDLENPDVFVLDVGGVYEPSKLNFDHHQMPDDSVPTCTVSLVLMWLRWYTDAKDALPWLHFTEVLDSKGKHAAAKELRMCSGDLQQTSSPIEQVVLTEFRQRGVINKGEWLWQLMELTGSFIVDYLKAFQDRLAFLQLNGKVVRLHNIQALLLLVPRLTDPDMGIDVYRRRLELDIAVSVVPDEGRSDGGGYAMYRFDDDRRVDFTRLKGDPRILWVHKNGYLAKTARLLPEEDVIELLERASTPSAVQTTTV